MITVGITAKALVGEKHMQLQMLDDMSEVRRKGTDIENCHWLINKETSQYSYPVILAPCISSIAHIVNFNMNW